MNPLLTKDQILIQLTRDPSAVKRQNLLIIMQEFLAAGYGPAVTIAAIVNAYAESRWSNTAFNPEVGLGAAKGWGSLGLFQILKSAHTPPRGAGRALSLPPMQPNGQPAPTDFRRDPTINTRVIIGELKAYWDTTTWGGVDYSPSVKEAFEGGTVADVSAAFCRHIERPADRVNKGYERAQLTYELFPELAGLPARLLEWDEPIPEPSAMETLQTKINAPVAAGLLLLTLVLGAVLTIYLRRK